MNRPLVIGVAGNPNSGKTSLFNRLTGANLKVGNWAGVTVEKREGTVSRGENAYTFVDIPGTYGLSARSIDEKIAIQFLTREKPDVVMVVLDAANFNRNFYLFTAIAEMGIPLIGVLNMSDVAERRGVQIDVENLSQYLGVPFVRTVASKGRGVDEIWQIIENGAFGVPEHTPEYPEPMEHAVDQLVASMPEHARSRFHALAMLEGNLLADDPDSRVRNRLAPVQAEVEHDLDAELDEVIAEKRYEFVYSISKEFVQRKMSREERVAMTDRIDRYVTNRYLGVPLFLAVMWLMFVLVFQVGNPIADLMDGTFASLASSITGTGFWASFIRDGLISGVGAVLVFVPNIFILFLIIAVMEDTGYLARAAFVADRFMHALGLHGKSFIPMLLGFGCNIPAVMAVRTMESEKDRVLTGLAIPFMSCSARLPVYLLFAGLFFPRNASTVVFAMYLAGIGVAIVVARMIRHIWFTGVTTPLIMELPAYHAPELKSVIRSAAIRTGYFVRKAGTFILVSVLVIWILASYPSGAGYASADSYIGQIGSWIAPILKPAGFESWQSAVALVFGFLAKEVVIGTFGTLYGGEAALAGALQLSFTPLSAISFLVMVLLYIPCVATIAVMRRELGGRWAAISVAISMTLGYGLAVLVFQVGRLMGLG